MEFDIKQFYDAKVEEMIEKKSGSGEKLKDVKNWGNGKVCDRKVDDLHKIHRKK